VAELILLLLLLCGPGRAAERAGVTMPDTIQLGEASLVLNGIGLRERFFLDQLVVGLYLPSRTSTSTAALDPSLPKSLRLHVVCKELPVDELKALLERGRDPQRDAELDPHFQRFEGWLLGLRKGDVLTLDYQPEVGTELGVNGSSRGLIEGPAFMQALWRSMLGPDPVSRSLKEQLLGE
jgi:hypothetical protein